MVQLDGNPADMASVLLGVLTCFACPLVRARSARTRYRLKQRILVLDFVNGTLLVPFGLLFASAFSTGILSEALTLNRVFFAVAGFMALVFTSRELFGSLFNATDDDRPSVVPSESGTV